MFVKIIEFDVLEYTEKVVNNIQKYRLLFTNSKEYQIKWADWFGEWCINKWWTYLFDNKEKTNLWIIPSWYDCRCKAMEWYLLEKWYIPFIITDKRHIRIEWNKTNNIITLITNLYNKLKLWNKN